MDEYQVSVVTEFFKPFPAISPTSCHEFILEYLASKLLPAASTKATVEPCHFQGSLSYTTILSSPQHRSVIVQFRSEEQDLFGPNEANRIHGDIAPGVTFLGRHQSLFVYTAPLIQGKPYINCLMSSESDWSAIKSMTTMLDIADLLTRGLQVNGAVTDHSTFLHEIKSRAEGQAFRNLDLRDNILTCATKILEQKSKLQGLPPALTHPDLSPFNYLVDETTGHVTAVLDWDGASYHELGRNFHFIDSFFGYMTPKGWVDNEDRTKIESVFHKRILENLGRVGCVKVTKEHLELSKAVGVLDYYLERTSKLKDERTERYFADHLQRLTIMNDLDISH